MEKLELAEVICANCGNDKLEELQAVVVDSFEGDYEPRIGNIVFLCVGDCKQEVNSGEG